MQFCSTAFAFRLCIFFSVYFIFFINLYFTLHWSARSAKPKRRVIRVGAMVTGSVRLEVAGDEGRLV